MHPSLMALKQNNPMRQQGWLAKGGLGALCCFFPSHLAHSLPPSWQEQGVQEGMEWSHPATTFVAGGAWLSPLAPSLPSTMTQFSVFQQLSLKIDQSCGRGKATGSGLACPGPHSPPHTSVQAEDQQLFPLFSTFSRFSMGWPRPSSIPTHTQPHHHNPSSGIPAFFPLVLLSWLCSHSASFQEQTWAASLMLCSWDPSQARRGNKPQPFAPLTRISDFFVWQKEHVQDMGSLPGELGRSWG